MFLGVVREIKNNCPINGRCEKLSENKLCYRFFGRKWNFKNYFCYKKF